MSVDVDLLETLVKNNNQEFQLMINDNDYLLSNVVIENSSIPVNEPTTRGGVYFSDKFAYKMKGVIKDLSVVPLLTKKMLGPNTEFGELTIKTTANIDGNQKNLEISTNLTNSVQTPDSIELSMIIVKLESV